MARAAAGDVLHAAHVVLLNQGSTEFGLIGKTFSVNYYRIRARGLLIPHVEYLIAWAQMIFGRAMTAKTPLHLQRFLLIHQRHKINRAMTGIAAHALCHVDAVIEIDEVRKLVHPRPLQRFTGAIAGTNRLKELRVRPDLRVAIHASLGRWNPGKTRSLNRCMAVAAIDAEAAYVMLMAKWNWLRLANTGVGDVRRTLDFIGDPS